MFSSKNCKKEIDQITGKTEFESKVNKVFSSDSSQDKKRQNVGSYHVGKNAPRKVKPTQDRSEHAKQKLKKKLVPENL